MEKDSVMNIDDYRDMLIGGLNDEEWVNEEIAEVRAAKVGTIKANYWEKISDDEIIVYCM